MNWIAEMHKTQPIGHALLVLAIVAAIGLSLGSLKIRGVGLGVAGVLFSGLLVAQMRMPLDATVLSFVRDFGLILFVYTIGLQVGPGFLTSLRRQGLPLNLMAVGVVFLGAVITVLLAVVFRVDWAASVGLFAGATTNTPALGAAQEALKVIPGLDPAKRDLPALGYAVAYPFGIIGIILSMVLLRSLFRIDLKREAEEFHRSQSTNREPLVRLNLLVENTNLNGLKLADLPGLRELEIVISRIRRAGEVTVSVARAETPVRSGDILLAVGTRANLEKLRLIVGKESGEDLTSAPGSVTNQRVVVTRKKVLGSALQDLELPELYGVIVSRVTRADIEMTAIADLKLQYGDVLQLVGEQEAIEKAAQALGNSFKEMSHTNLVPIFIGIVLGILLGSYPFWLGEMPAPVRLGLAGGPLIVAIVLSRIGKIGRLVWYMPSSANILLRELGIVLFLSAVGLRAGEHFVDVLVHGAGLTWMAWGAVITILPLVVMGCIGRLFLKLNFMNLCGLLAGSMTDPPALAFANTVNRSDAPSVAYATVYPLTMLLRILVAQILVLALSR